MRPFESSSTIGAAELCLIGILAAFLFAAPSASGADVEYLPVCNLSKYLDPQFTANQASAQPMPRLNLN